MPPGDTCANAWPISPGPSKPSDSASSGIGGTRLDHTSSAIGSGAWAWRVQMLPAPQQAAEPMHSATATIGTPSARPAAMIAMPAKATRRAGELGAGAGAPRGTRRPARS